MPLLTDTPRFLYLKYPPWHFARPKLLVSFLQVYSFLPKPRLAQTIPPH